MQPNYNIDIDLLNHTLENACLTNYSYDELMELSEIIKRACITNILSSSPIEFCPFCHSIHFCKAGKNDKGEQRYKCKECHRRFVSRTNRMTHWSHLNVEQWMILLQSIFNNDSLHKTAELVGISVVSAFYNRHKILYILEKISNNSKLHDIVEIDETFLTYQAKGYINQNKRGISEDKIGITCAIDNHGHFIVHTGDRGRPQSKSLIEILQNKIEPKSKVVSDSQRSYHPLMETLDVEWIKIESGEKEKDGFTLDRINQLHNKIKEFFRGKRNVVTHYLQGYLSLFQYIQHHVMMIGTKHFQKEYYNLNKIYSGLRIKDICSGVNLYKTFYKH